MPPTSGTGRPLVAAVALGSVPAFVFVDTAYAWLCGWRSPNALPLAIAGISALALLVLTVAYLRAPGRRWLAAHSHRLMLLIVAAASAWVLAEVAVALTFGTRLWFHHYPPNLVRTLHPREDILRGVHGPSRLSFNALGIRGRELPEDRGVRRILCIGGSTTLCFYLDDAETWPAQLEARLAQQGQRCWVGNLGQSGYGTRHHVRYTRRSPLLGEVDDVVFLLGFNDFVKALVGGPLEGGSGVAPLWLHSPILAALQNIYQARRTQQVLQEDDAARVYEVRRDLRRDANVVQRLPDLDRHLEAYRRNVRDLVAHVRAAGARPVLASNPVKWHSDHTTADDELWFGHLDTGEVLDPAALRAGMAQFEQALRAVAAELEVTFVDLAALHGADEVFFDDCHLTEEGARRVAELLASAFPAHAAKPRGRR